MWTSYEIKPAIDEIFNEYKALRLSGQSRDSAVDELKRMYSDALADDEDRGVILCTIALALCKKKELTESISCEAIRELKSYLANPELDSARAKCFQRLTQTLQDPSMYGNEAVYRPRKRYTPDWQVGDLFSHTITCPLSEKRGIYGWSALFYKVAEFHDPYGECRHLFYISLCPPGCEPINGEQLNAIGFLPMMPHDNGWDYLGQITVKSKKAEQGYNFTKIANFTDIVPPPDRTTENPLVSMPIFGRLRKDECYPGYEDQICSLYRDYGKYMSAQK